MFVKYDVTLKEQSSIPVKRPITGNEDAYSKSLYLQNRKIKIKNKSKIILTIGNYSSISFLTQNTNLRKFLLFRSYLDSIQWLNSNFTEIFFSSCCLKVTHVHLEESCAL